jgi:hypothetical protein
MKRIIAAIALACVMLSAWAQDFPAGMRKEIVEIEQDDHEYSLFSYKDADGTFGYYLSLGRVFPILEAEIFGGVDRSLLVEKNGRLWFRLADGRPYCDAIDERSEVVKITVPPMSVKRISIDSVILGNSCGGIKHWVVLG